MLVLTRKHHEAIHVGDDIRIVIVDIKKGMVRIAIEAPPDVLILRGELRTPDQEGEAKDGR